MNDDAIIVKHGKEYDEEMAMYDKYPVAICPECMSSNISIIATNNEITFATWDKHTGDQRYINKGILRIKQENVNYRCKSCKCAFRKWYDVKEGKTQVSGKCSAIIITGLIFVFSAVAALCAKEAEEGVLLSNGGYFTDGFVCWHVCSIFASVISFIVFVVLCFDKS
jgi:hypothetical protein